MPTARDSDGCAPFITTVRAVKGTQSGTPSLEVLRGMAAKRA
jgi:hypothetical protein